MRVHTYSTMLELYILYYNTTIWVPWIEGDKLGECGSKPYKKLDTFQEEEEKIVFLIYNPSFLKNIVMTQWLSKQRGINGSEGFGHPLTELKGGVYLHRIRFRTAADCSFFLRKANQIRQRTSIHFARSWEHFKVIIHKGYKIFMARQSPEMLHSLEISERMTRSVYTDDLESTL
uniref:uncharacterized protein LOC105351578 n=1 Tax=Fragaria vesca subsp. vesca TaxID=101020 RepID=UPI0005CB355D|nr:PREDICTED: uncharacterized protein LOC105351578 [Fragaria vesca subsp. vesca]